MMPSQREISAYHEAGHVAVALEFGVKVRRATIKPRAGYAGQVSFYGKLRPSDKPEIIRFKVERHLLCTLAGPFAQKCFAPRSSWRRGNHSGSRILKRYGDFDVVLNIIHQIYGDDTTKAKGYQRLLEKCAAKLVNKWWGVIEVVAKTLLERETLTGDEIWKVLDEAERQEKLEMRRRKRRLKTLRAR